MSVLRRLYRGETRLDFIGARKRWYLASAIILLVCIGSMAIRQFNFGIEFAGGSQFVVPAKSGTTLSDVRGAVEETGAEIASTQERGSGAQRKYVVRTAVITDEESKEIVEKIAEAAEAGSTDEVEVKEVSSSWGKSVTNQALLGLVVFLVLVALYLWIRYEQKMAFAALFALIHDLLLTAGVYSLVGFEVTPGTVIGLLTILGYSLYDTVVVFDKVDENTRGILGHNRFDYQGAANLAVNQTLMRSINTSLIALLPVGGLLFVGAGILGVGTLKDLALVLFVGMLTGAYSSLFLATPWLVDLKMLDPKYKAHAQRVATRAAAVARGEDPDRRTARARAAKAAAGRPQGALVATGSGSAGTVVETPADDVEKTTAPDEQVPVARRPGAAPRTGARPAGRKRPSGGRKR